MHVCGKKRNDADSVGEELGKPLRIDFDCWAQRVRSANKAMGKHTLWTWTSLHLGSDRRNHGCLPVVASRRLTKIRFVLWFSRFCCTRAMSARITVCSMPAPT